MVIHGAAAGISDQEYHSPSMNRTVSFKIYTPPGYESGDQRYPVVYNLHGAGGGDPQRQWDRTRRTLTRAMEEKLVRPMIYVYVNGLGSVPNSTMFADTHDGTRLAATTFIKELIPHVDAHWRTIADRGGRAVDGFSMGGFGALTFAFTHPQLFCAVVSYGGALVSFERMSAGIRTAAYGDNQEHFDKFSPYAWLEKNADEIRRSVRVRLVVGANDNLLDNNARFKEMIEKHNIPVSWRVVEGRGHETGALFDHSGIESLKFIEAAFEGRPWTEPAP